MPNWQPDWHDVRWNHDASGQAASELRRVADEIDRSCSERSRIVEQTMQEWRGVHRGRFDNHLRDASRRFRALADEYRAVAARIDAAAQRAREEQTRRVRDRERWRLEKEAEDRRRDPGATDPRKRNR
jgi:uncharacterized protein YukE